MKSKLLVVIVTVSMILGGILGFLFILSPNDPIIENPEDENIVSYSSLNTFNSYEEIENFLAEQAALAGGDYNMRNLTGYYFTYDTREMAFGSNPASDSSHSSDFSDTNVQVKGVDEGDIMKTDGKYAYIVSRNLTRVYIIDVYPAEDAKIVYTLELEWKIREIYINNDKLVVLGTTCYYYSFYGSNWFDYYSYQPETNINVYDLNEKDNPKLTRSIQMKGSYVSSRMIDDYLYLIVNQYASQIKNESDLPVSPQNIFFAPEYDYWYTFTTIMSVNTQNPSEKPFKISILIGVSTHIYVSPDNIYLSSTKTMSWVERMEKQVDEVITPIVSSEARMNINSIQSSGYTRGEKLRQIDEIVGSYKSSLNTEEQSRYNKEYDDRNSIFQESIAKEMQKTVIHRVSVKDGWIRYEASGGVPGYVLNRFSMDEFQDYFRIATTTGQRWWWGNNENGLNNHVFVLDMDLNIVGSVKNIAPGESIYSARFMGKRGYLVTFKKVDPFFVIDLSNPTSPSILGELKIPGYSNYLHPYDENHVIGLGKDAVDMEDFAWYQGVKLSLFDVTDVRNPKEKAQYIIGDRGTESLALTDPHAFLFSKSKNLLVIPVVLKEIDDSKYPDGAPPQTYGEYKWCGAYVFSVDSESGFQLQGGVTHIDGEEPEPGNYWYIPYNKRVKRSFYIEDVLYTLSDNLIKANALDDLEEINSIELED